MIPLHLRLTERWKIDPTYPNDDAKWWQAEERKTDYRYHMNGYPDRTTDQQKEVLEYIREHGPVTVTDIRQDMGLPRNVSTAMIDGLSKIHPIYQERRGDGMNAYQLLPENFAREDEMSSLQASDGPDFEAMHEVRQEELGGIKEYVDE
jgi:hypothetical protein